MTQKKQSPCRTCLDRNICHWQQVAKKTLDLPYCVFKTFGDPDNRNPDKTAENTPANLTQLTIEAVSFPN